MFLHQQMDVEVSTAATDSNPELVSLTFQLDSCGDNDIPGTVQAFNGELPLQQAMFSVHVGIIISISCYAMFVKLFLQCISNDLTNGISF